MIKVYFKDFIVNDGEFLLLGKYIDDIVNGVSFLENLFYLFIYIFGDKYFVFFVEYGFCVSVFIIMIDENGIQFYVIEWQDNIENKCNKGMVDVIM